MWSELGLVRIGCINAPIVVAYKRAFWIFMRTLATDLSWILTGDFGGIPYFIEKGPIIGTWVDWWADCGIE